MEKNKFIRHLVSLSPYLIASLLLFSACDKIEEGEYTVYDGVTVQWYPSTSSVEAVQRVYVEKFTGPRCNNCPKADATLAGIHNDNVVMVAINHPTGQGVPYPGQPDMRTDGGEVWANWFGVSAIPAAYINRDKGTQYLGEMSNIVSDIAQALTEEPVVALETYCLVTDNNADVSVYLHFERNYERPVTLTVALVEDSLCYQQLMPDYSVEENYAHNHMLRKVLTSYWGTDVPTAGRAGEGWEGKMKFRLDDGVVPEHCHIVAFVSDKETRKVLNCAQGRLN